MPNEDRLRELDRQLAHVIEHADKLSEAQCWALHAEVQKLLDLLGDKDHARSR